MQAGLAHVLKRVQAILEGAGGDDFLVMFGAGVEVVVVIVEPRFLEPLGLL